MKKRMYSLFLAFVLCLSFASATARTDGAEPAGPPDALSAAYKDEKDDAPFPEDAPARTDDAGKAPDDGTDSVPALTSVDAGSGFSDSDKPSPEEEAVLLDEGDFGHVIYTNANAVDAGQSGYYTFTPSHTATYVFESTNATGDTYGWIEDESGTQLAYNDDGGSANGNSRNFRLSYVLHAGVTYSYGLRWYSSSTSGDISVRLTRLTGNIFSISSGSSVAVDINTGGELKYFRFSPAATGTYVFESTNASGDPRCYLYDSSLSLLDSNDDGGDANGNNRNFKLSASLTAGQTYYYAVRWYSNSATGSLIARLNQQESVKALGQPTASSPATSYETIGTGGETKYFSFVPSVSQTYVFESTNASGDPYGSLYDSTKSTRLAYDDDSAGNRNFRIRYDLTAGATYYYGVRFYSSDDTGRIDVRLSVARANDVIPLSADEVYLKAYATATVSGTEGNAVGYCSFTPRESGTYLLESTASSGDPKAFLYASIGGSALAQDDDSGTLNGNDRNFKLSYSLTAGTTYYYGVKWLGDDSPSMLQVRIRRELSEVASRITVNSTVSANVNELGKAVYFSFTPSASQQFVFQSTGSDSGFDPYATLYDANLTPLESNDDGAGSLQFRIARVLESGVTYYLGVKRLNDSSTGTVSVRLSGDIPVIQPTSSLWNGGWNGSAAIRSPGDYAYFAFSPQVSGTYVFSSVNDSGDPYGYLYADGPGSGELKHDDDSGNGRNFSVSHYLFAGRTYWYGVRWYNSSVTGTVNVNLRLSCPALDAAAVERDHYATASADITENGGFAYFSFTPESAGTYVFESTNATGDTVGYLFSDGPGLGQTVANSDGGSGYNFSIERELTARATYYYGVRWDAAATTGTIYVRISKDVPAVVPTGVSVRLAESSIYVGNSTAATAQVTPSSATDKTVTWSSSNRSVATVTSAGVVTGVGAGSATISARTSNGVSGSATVTVRSTAPSTQSYYPDFTYSFGNTERSFSTSGSYRIPMARYMQLGFSQAVAEEMVRNWGGSCFGMSVSSTLFYKGVLQEEKYNSGVQIPHHFSAPSSNSASDTKLRSMIELFQVSQSMPSNVNGGGGYEQPDFDPSAIMTQLSQGNPVGMGLRDRYGRGWHEVVIYNGTRSGSTYEFDIYDCSSFVTHLSYTSRTQYSFTYQNRQYDWVPEDYCVYDTMRTKYNALKNNNYNGAASLLSLPDGRNYVYIFCPAGYALSLVNADGQQCLISEFGELLGNSIEDLTFHISSYLSDEQRYSIIVPESDYTITGPESVTFADANLAIEAHFPQGTPITVSSNLYDADLATVDGAEYSVTYKLYNDYFDTLSVSGVAGGAVSASLKDEEIGGEHVQHIEVKGAATLTAQAVTGQKSVTTGGQSVGGNVSVQWPVNESGNAVLNVLSASAPASGGIKESAANTGVKGDALIAEREQTHAPTFVLHTNPESGEMELEILCDDDAILYYYITEKDSADLHKPGAGQEDEFYVAPVLVTPSMRVVAMATKYGDRDSEIESWTYEGGTDPQEEGPVPALAYGRSLSLEGNIGVNFYILFPETLRSDPDAYITLNEQKTLISTAPTRSVSGTEYGFFTYTVPAKQMNRTITLRVYDGADNLYPLVTMFDEDVTQGFDYSVRTYLANALNMNAKLRDLCLAMSDYGSCAQRYFGYDVASAADIVQDLNAVTGDELQSYARKLTTAENAGVAYAGTSVILESETSIRHVFTLREGDISDYVFAVNGKPTQPVFKDNYYSVYIGNIAAKNLGQSFTVTVSKDGEVILSVEYSVLTYAYSVLTYDESKLQGMGDVEALKNLARSLCLYNRAARAYFER